MLHNLSFILCHKHLLWDAGDVLGGHSIFCAALHLLLSFLWHSPSLKGSSWKLEKVLMIFFCLLKWNIKAAQIQVNLGILLIHVLPLFPRYWLLFLLCYTNQCLLKISGNLRFKWVMLSESCNEILVAPAWSFPTVVGPFQLQSSLGLLSAGPSEVCVLTPFPPSWEAPASWRPCCPQRSFRKVALTREQLLLCPSQACCNPNKSIHKS